MKVVPTKRKTTEKDSRRDNSFFMSFTVHCVQKQFCKKNFLGILDQGEKFVLNVLKNEPPISSSQLDLRNKSSPRNQKARVTEDQSKLATDVKSFPAVDFHYCISNSTKKYLSAELSQQKMYNL
jgi:hypothetical protein